MSERAEEIATECAYEGERPSQTTYLHCRHQELFCKAASTIRTLTAERDALRHLANVTAKETICELVERAEAAEFSLASLRERVRGVLEPIVAAGSPSPYPTREFDARLSAARAFLSTLPHDGEGI